MKGVGREMASQMSRERASELNPKLPADQPVSTLNPKRIASATIDIGLIEADSVAPGASMVNGIDSAPQTPAVAAPDADGLVGGMHPELAAMNPALQQSNHGAAAASPRLQGVERSGKSGAKRGGEDLKDLVKLQSKRRQRRASLEIQQTPEQQAAMKRWRKLDTSIQLGSALASAVKTAGDERKHLSRLHRQGSMRALLNKNRPKLFGNDNKGPPTCRDGVIHPRSAARRRWDFVLFAMLLYCAFLIPFRVGFDAMAEGGWLWFETAIDITFMVDVIANFRTGYLLDEDNEDSRIEMRPKAISWHYFRGWFVIDLVSAFPTQLVKLAKDEDAQTGAYNKLPRLMRIPRLVRMIRLMKLMRLVRLFRPEQQGVISRLIRTSGLPPAVMRALRLVLLTIMLSHTLACGWFFCHVMAPEGKFSWWDVYCGKADHEDTLELTKEDGVYDMNIAEREAIGIYDPELCRGDTMTRYIVSLYWAVTTLTTMGYGDITPKVMGEYIYTIVVMLMGVSFYAYIASNVSIVLANMDEAGSEYRDNMEKLGEFMTRKRMTLPLRRRLRKYFHVYWKSRGRIGVYNDVDIVNLITLPALRNDVTTELFREITRQVPFLHDKDPRFIEMIAPKMTLLRIADGEYVVKEGERGQDLFFLLTGVVHCEYETDAGETFTLISHEAGQYFGDVAMFLLERNITSFRAHHPDGEEVELYMLSRLDLDAALTGNVEVARDMRDIAQEKMSLMKLQIQVLQNQTANLKSTRSAPSKAKSPLISSSTMPNLTVNDESGSNKVGEAASGTDCRPGSEDSTETGGRGQGRPEEQSHSSTPVSGVENVQAQDDAECDDAAGQSIHDLPGVPTVAG